MATRVIILDPLFILEIEVIIIINGKNREVRVDTMTYEELVELAYPGRGKVSTSYLVSYSYQSMNRGGTLVPGSFAELEHGMIFHLSPI